MVNMCINAIYAMLFKLSFKVSVHKQNILLLLKWKHEIYVCEATYTNLDMFKGFQFLFNYVASQCPFQAFSWTM